MPVICPVQFTLLTPDEFTALDYRLMPCFFASQNELGRLCDERIYEADAKARLEEAGFIPVRTQVPVRAVFRDFGKDYALDLTVCDSGIYELKAAAALTGNHKAQLLNYLLLLDLRSGKLVNFHPPRVESEFVSTTLTREERRRIRVDDKRWQPMSDACHTLRDTLLEILFDWGAFLELGLYREALLHFLGGEDVVWRNIELARAGRALGVQHFAVYEGHVGFKLTAMTDDHAAAESQIRKFLALTPLRAIQWINLNRFEAEFVTLKKA